MTVAGRTVRGVIGRPLVVPAVGALIGLSGCAAAGPAPGPGEQTAILVSADDAYVEHLDGAENVRGFEVPPLTLTPGRHTVRLRRRLVIEDRMGVRVVDDYPIRLGSGSMGRVAMMSEGTCTATFEARAGATYTVRTTPGAEGELWRGSISGDGADATCLAADSVPRSLVGQTRYLCCTMVFASDEATDANYRYEDAGARWIPAGTPVFVTKAARNSVAFRVDDAGPVYWLYLEYGNHRIEAPAYFDIVLRATDPTTALAAASPEVKRAVADGRLLPGMTKDEAILARGYPPLHHTASLEANEWIYYESPLNCDYVTFVNGVLQTIRRGPSP